MKIEDLQNKKLLTKEQKYELKLNNLKRSGYKCEGCGECEGYLENHHSITGKNRRELYEAEWNTYIVGKKCHENGAVKMMLLKRTQQNIRDKGGTDDQIREITGKKCYL